MYVFFFYFEELEMRLVMEAYCEVHISLHEVA